MTIVPTGQRIDIPGFGLVHGRSHEAHWLGTLLGLAIGDALGTTHEFEQIDQPPYPTLATRPATDVTGGGPFDLAPGQYTDDTQLAICLARSLMDRAGLDVPDLARRFVAWSEHAFDIGNQTSAAVHRLRAGGASSSAGSAGIDVWHASGRRAAGNGSLMRTAPLGVWFNTGAPINDSRVVESAIAESMITHADPRCTLACAMFDLAIAQGASNGPNQLAAARGALALGATQLRAAWHDAQDVAAIDAAEIDLGRDLDAAISPNPSVYGLELDVDRTAGFVRVALRLAFWHSFHQTSYRDAVVDVASRGGDADTNAAIVGALIGSRDGVTAIPITWIERVLGATPPGPPEWGDAHHPKHLLAFAEYMRTRRVEILI